MAKNHPEGHRSHVRDKFRDAGHKLDGFLPHEIVEFLLFYAIPRRDTKQIAYQLLEKFGSVHGVMNAKPEALKSVKYVGDNVVTLLAFFKELNAYISVEQSLGKPMDNAVEVRRYFEDLYRLERNEIVRVAYLDDTLCLKCCVDIAEGHPSAVSFLTRNVMELAFINSSNALILAHNHPNSSSIASSEDIAATKCLYHTLQSCGIKLVDHVIVGRDGSTSLREDGGFFGIE